MVLAEGLGLHPEPFASEEPCFEDRVLGKMMGSIKNVFSPKESFSEQSALQGKTLEYKRVLSRAS